jgi:DNA-binding NarL/FixJ family response regulator
MQSYTLHTRISEDGILRVNLPVPMQNTEVKVTLGIEQIESKSSSAMERSKAKYRRAYQSWTEGEEQRLMQLHNAGYSTQQIAQSLHRQQSAIRSRLRKISERGVSKA